MAAANSGEEVGGFGNSLGPSGLGLNKPNLSINPNAAPKLFISLSTVELEALRSQIQDDKIFAQNGTQIMTDADLRALLKHIIQTLLKSNIHGSDSPRVLTNLTTYLSQANDPKIKINEVRGSLLGAFFGLIDAAKEAESFTGGRRRLGRKMRSIKRRRTKRCRSRKNSHTSRR